MIVLDVVYSLKAVVGFFSDQKFVSICIESRALWHVNSRNDAVRGMPNQKYTYRAPNSDTTIVLSRQLISFRIIYLFRLKNPPPPVFAGASFCSLIALSCAISSSSSLLKSLGISTLTVT